MSIPCEIYIATEANGAHLAHLDSGYITPVELSSLWDLAAGVEVSFEGSDRFESSSEDGAEELVFAIPTAFCEELSRLRDGPLTAVAAAWAATEEIDADPADVQPVIEDLVNISEVSLRLETPLWLKVFA